MNVHLGIDIGGTKVRMGVVDEQGRIIARSQLLTRPEGGFDGVFGKMIKETGDLLAQASKGGMKVRSIGFGVPGTTDSNSGLVVFAPNMKWIDVDFATRVKEHIDIEVHIEQDTRAAAFAEFLFGAAKGSKSFACITIGTGIGCGIIIDGKICRGAENTAGELGHTIIRPHGELCGCGRRGCLEAYASGPAIARTAKRKLPNDLNLHYADALTAKEVYALAAQGVAEAKEVVEEAAELLGIAIANLVNILSLQKIVLSGGVSNAEDGLLLDPIRRIVHSNVYRLVADRVEISKSVLGEDAPLIGAAMLHRRRSIQTSIEK